MTQDTEYPPTDLPPATMTAQQYSLILRAAIRDVVASELRAVIANQSIIVADVRALRNEINAHREADLTRLARVETALDERRNGAYGG